jgi:Terminase RNaseH-like domain
MGSGTALIQELIREGVCGIRRYKPTMDKIMRVHSITGVLETGRVYLPEKAEWLDSYILELTTFPKGKYNDQADSTSQALDWAKQHTCSSPVADYGLREAKRLGWRIDPSLLDDDDQAENAIVICPICKKGEPAQYARRYHCNQCGHDWNVS